MLKTIVFQFALLLLFFKVKILSAISCKNEFGQNVDWFIAYKIPNLEDRKDILSTGLAYGFITSNQKISRWTISNNLINQSSSILGKTLSNFYKNGEEYTYVMYSDQPPNGKVSPNYAHGKGLVVLNDKNGIWISHSVPRFPPSFEESYSYPDSGRNFGQTVICVTFSNKEAAIDIVEHLLTIRPYIYSEYYAEPMMKIVKNFQSLKNRRWSSKKFLRKEIKSLANTEFILFSKSNKENYDLYDYYISPYIKSNLLAETWRRGAGRPLPSDCKPPFEVHNVQVVNLPFTSGKSKQSGEWKYLEDHSKWAISETKIKSFVCISDLNRMQSQFKRGGGAVCFRNAESWLLFKDSIAGIEGCPRNGSS